MGNFRMWRIVVASILIGATWNLFPAVAEDLTPEQIQASLKAGQRFHGKGMWIWNWQKCQGGDLQSIINKARWAGLSFVMIKVNDGQKSFGPSGVGDSHVIDNDLVAGFHTRGIAVHAWGYVYGNNPEQEAKRALSVLHDGKADGYVFDAESEYANRSKQAEKVCSLVRSHIDNCSMCKGKVLAYAPFPQVAKHRNYPYREFSRYCDYIMPQMYWYWGSSQTKTSPEYIVWQTYSQWLSWEDQLRREGNEKLIKPLIPIAQTSYCANPEEIFDFMSRVQGYYGISFWSWEHTSDTQWQVIKKGPYTGEITPDLLKANVKPKAEEYPEGVPPPTPAIQITFWERVWMFQPIFAPWRVAWWRDVVTQIGSSLFYGVVCGILGILLGLIRLVLGIIATILVIFLLLSHFVCLCRLIAFWWRKKYSIPPPAHPPTYTTRDWWRWFQTQIGHRPTRTIIRRCRF